jgi:hypothetical protein
MCRLEALKSILDGHDWFEPSRFDQIAGFARDARQDTIDAMRADLDLKGSAKPQTGKEYNKSHEEAVREAIDAAENEHRRRGAAS